MIGYLHLPIKALKQYFESEPITFIGNALMGLFMLFYGITLQGVDQRVYTFHQKIMPIEYWSGAFIISGLSLLVRDFLHGRSRLLFILHIVSSITITAWTSIWVLRSTESVIYLPATFTYLFVTSVCILLPFITPLTYRCNRKR